MHACAIRLKARECARERTPRGTWCMSLNNQKPNCDGLLCVCLSGSLRAIHTMYVMSYSGVGVCMRRVRRTKGEPLRCSTMQHKINDLSRRILVPLAEDPGAAGISRAHRAERTAQTTQIARAVGALFVPSEVGRARRVVLKLIMLTSCAGHHCGLLSYVSFYFYRNVSFCGGGCERTQPGGLTPLKGGQRGFYENNTD